MQDQLIHANRQLRNLAKLHLDSQIATFNFANRKSQIAIREIPKIANRKSQTANTQTFFLLANSEQIIAAAILTLSDSIPASGFSGPGMVIRSVT